MEYFGKITIFLTNFAKELILNLWGNSEYMLGFKYARVLNISKFLLKWRRCSYGRVLNIRRFWVCQVSAYASVVQSSEYVWIWLNNALRQDSEYALSTFHRLLNKPRVLNIVELKTCQGWKYARVIQGAEYTWTSLNIPS